jgi:predicted extracellular nuclease
MKSKFSLIFLVLCMSTSLLIGTTIYDIQYTTIAGDGTYPSLLVGQTVTFTGIVTANGYYSSGNSNRFFVSDPAGGAWKGVFVFSYDYTVSVGDEVEVSGEVQEYYGLTEIGNLTGVTVLSTGNPVPAAIPVATGDLLAPSTGEPYEGCLVKISDVTVTQGPTTYGEWYVNDGSGECQIDDAIFTYDSPSVGDTFASITGAVDYSYDEYGINPRDADDFSTSGGDTTPPTINSANASNETTVGIIFSEGLDQTTAETLANYAISPALTFSDATLQNNNQVILTTATQESGTAYTITVNNVEDLNGNVILPNSTVNFSGYTPGSGPDLFFSEYIEGSSQNKALEIYNGSGATVDLTNYRIAQAVNGNGWAYWHEFPAGSTLVDGEVWVITTDEADAQLQAVADEILSYPSVVHHNGDDARGLEKTTDGGTSWALLDIIGNPDEDPGNGWDVAGTPAATYDHTLVRKASITEGTADWTASAGTTAGDSQWIVYPVDTFEYLGYHGENDTTPPTLASANATSPTAVEVTFNEQVDQTTAETIANYSVTNLTITDAILQSLGKTVELITTAQDPGYAYTVTVNNVEDLAGNVILPNSTIGFTGYEEGPTEGQLIFSEYIEGSSNNKALELYNASSLTVFLDNYRIAQSVNGNGWQYWHNFPTGATLAPGDVWVLCADEAAQTILNVADEALAYPSVAHFTGNDARGIEMTTDGGATWTLIDLIGIPTDDPGTGWDVAGVTAATQNHTLVRKNAVESGNTDWTAAAGTNEGDSEWIVYPIDTFEYIGSHGGGVGGNVTISNLDPAPGEAVTVTLSYTDSLQNPVLYWNTVRQNPFSQVAMSPAKDYSWEVELPGQDAGTVVFFYIAAEDAEQNMLYFPEDAPEEVFEYDYGITDFSAILKVPHYTFCPTLGETFQIQFHSRVGDKLVLRLYNSEGVLVNTFTNEMSTGMHTFEWDGKDDNWNTLPPGLYICNLEVVNPDNGDIKNKSVPIVISAPLK